MKVTFDKSVSLFILKAFDWHLNADGYVVDAKGNDAPSMNNKPTHIDDFLGVIKDLNTDTPVLINNIFDLLGIYDS